jgi:hypothetical protein
VAPAPTRALPPADSAALLVAIEKKWASSMMNGDRAFLEGLFTDDAVIAKSRGTFWTKQQELDDEFSPDLKIIESKLDEPTVRLHGTTAIVSGSGITRFVEKGVPGIFRFVYVDTFAWTGERWLCVANASTEIGPNATSADAEIRASRDSLSRALADKNPDAVAAQLDDSYKLQLLDGTSATKKDVLDALRAGKLVAADSKHEDVQIDRRGKFATLRTRTSGGIALDGRKLDDKPLIRVDSLIFANQAWVLLETHYVPVAAAKPKPAPILPRPNPPPPKREPTPWQLDRRN